MEVKRVWRLRKLEFQNIIKILQNYVDGKISRVAFWELAKFKKPTHQISFHTAKALTTLQFIKSYEVYDEE